MHHLTTPGDDRLTDTVHFADVIPLADVCMRLWFVGTSESDKAGQDLFPQAVLMSAPVHLDNIADIQNVCLKGRVTG